MAKKKVDDGEIDLDDFDFEDFEIDIPEFDDPDPTLDDRKPVEKLASGFKEGLTASIASPDQIKRSLSIALPRGYAQAINVYDAVDDTTRELYHSVTEDLRPVTDGLRVAASKVSPKIKAKLPKSLSDRLDKFAEGGNFSSGDYSASKMKRESEDSQIASSISELFEAQASREDEFYTSDKSDEVVRDTLTAKRHEQSMDQMTVVAQGISRLVGYQDNVLTKYQQKSLELQFRHYFVAKDLLDITSENNGKVISAMDKLVKNTALPEAVKIQQSEMASQMLKERMIGSMFKNIGNFTRNFRENLTNNAIDLVKGFSGSITGATDQVGGMVDTMGVERSAGMAAGMTAAEKLHDAVATRLAPFLEKMPGLRKFGARIGNALGNAPKRLNRWAKSETEGTGVVADLTELAKGVVPRYYLDDRLNTNPVMDSDQPATFDNLTRRSIVEIIPGWLSQINRWTKAIATGQLDSEKDMDVYNLEKGTFTSRDTYLKDIKRRVLPRQEVDSMRTTLDNFVTELDDRKELSPEIHKSLKKAMITRLANGDEFEPSLLTKREFYKDLPEEHVDDIRYFFKNKFGISFDGEVDDDSVENLDAIGKFQGKFNSMDNILPNTGDYVRNLYEVLGRDNFKQLGFAQRVGNRESLDYNNIFDAILGDDLGAIDNNPVQERTYSLNRAFGGQPLPSPTPPPAPALPPQPTINAPAPTPQLDLDAYLGRDSILLAEIMGLRTDVKANNISELINVSTQVLNEINSKIGFTGNPNGAPGAGAPSAQTGRLMKALKGGVSGAWSLGKGYGNAVLSAYKGIGDAGWWTAGKTLGGIGAMGRGFFRRGEVDETGKPGKSLFDHTLGGIGAAGKGLFDLYKLPVKTAYHTAKTVARGGWDTSTGIVRGMFQNAKDIDWADKVIQGGEYFDSVTKKPIKRLKDLKGELVDRYDKKVNLDELSKQGRGFLNRMGEKVGNGIASVAGAAADVGISGLGLYGKALMMPFKAMAWVGNKLSGFGGRLLGRKPEFSSKFRPTGQSDNDLITLNYYQLSVQERMYSLLHDALGKKGTKFDGDGDGVRDGSVADLLFKRKKKKKEDEAAQTAAEAKRNKGLWGSVGGMLSGVLGKIFGKKKNEDEEDEDESLTDRLGSRAEDYLGDKAEDWIDDKIGSGDRDDGNGDNRQDRSGRRTGRRGRFGKLRSFGGKALKYGGKALGGAGAAYGAYSAYNNLKEGNYGDAAIDTGIGLAGIAAMGGGGAMMTGLTAAGSAIAGIVSLPVLLGAGAVALTGYGAYKAYKHITGKPRPLSGLRFSQYGLDPRDSDTVSQVSVLEQMLMKNMQYDPEGASVNKSGLDGMAMLKLFGIDPTNEDHQQRVYHFTEWLRFRFIPVLTTYAEAINKLAKGVSLVDLNEKLPAQQGLDFIKAVRRDDLKDVYDATEYSPFDDDLDSDSGDVNDWVEDAIEYYEDKVEDMPVEKEKMDSVTTRLAKSAAVTATGLTAKGSGSDKPVTTGELTTSSSGLGKSFGEFGLVGKAMTSPLIAAVPLGFVVGGWSTMKDVVGVLYPEKKRPKVTLDAMTAARYKIYGLVDLDVEKVEALYNLEETMWNDVKYDGDKRAYYNGTPDSIYPVVKSFFEILPDDATHRANWFTWFRFRYLPVFVQFCTSVRAKQSIDARNAVDKLTLDEQHEVVVQINTVQSDYEGITHSVWKVHTSPWKGYTLNNDETSIAGNIEMLKTAGKRAGYKDRSQKVADAKSEIEAARKQEKIDKEGNYAPGQDTEEDDRGFWSKTLDKVIGTKGKDGSRDGGWFSGKLDPSKANDDVSGGSARPLKAGAVIQEHPGGGTGGDINSIPAPTGKGWQGSRATILAAAKMAGFDPHIASTIAGLESDFDPGAQAGTSSAGGYYQFIDDTWKSTLKKHGSKYGLAANASKFDGRANALMGMEFLKENMEYLKKRLNRPITDVDLYAAHFLGPHGAGRFLEANPGADSRYHVGEKVPGANHNIFFDKSNRARTVSEVYEEFDRRLVSSRKKHDVEPGFNFATEKVDEQGNLSTTSAVPSETPVATPDPVSTDPVGEIVTAESAPPPAPITMSAKAVEAGKTTAAAQGVQATSTNGLTSSDGSVEEGRPSPVVQAAVATKQASAETGALNASMGTVSDLMSQQLGVQSAMDAKLGLIVELLKIAPSASSVTADRAEKETTPAMKPKRSQTGSSSSLSKVPVNVDRQRTL